MLANVAVIAAIVALAVTTSVSATYAAAKAVIHRNAERYADAAFADALANVRDRIASNIAAGEPMPSFTPSPPQPVCGPNDASCAYYASSNVTLETSAAITSNMEADANVSEDRITADIVVTILAPDRTILSVREKRTSLRTLRTPPYAVIAGARDATADFTAQPVEGDDGGLPPSAPNSACSPSTNDETLVRAQYYNDASGACTDESTWKSQPGTARGAPQWTP